VERGRMVLVLLDLNWQGLLVVEGILVVHRVVLGGQGVHVHVVAVTGLVVVGVRIVLVRDGWIGLGEIYLVRC